MPAVPKALKQQISQPNYRVNGLALTYIVVGYGVSIGSITASSWLINILGVLLLTHTLVWAAYFVHEFIHGTVFRGPKLNALGAQVMLFLTGSCYCRYWPLARYHLAHHKNRADFSAFSMGDFLRSLPKPLLTLIEALEQLYFPAIDFILRWFCALSPFLGETHKDDRWRNGGLLLIRGSLFVALAWYSWQTTVLYFIAYLCFLNILRFMDCFQHTYTVVQMGRPMPQFSPGYEERNTYSNLVLGRWHWLNLLFLNFGYHNAHHQVIYCPWHLLPQLDAELYPARYPQRVSLGSLVKNYHQFRMQRLFGEKSSVVETDDGLDFKSFYGDIGVSFLVLREPLDWLTLKAQDTSGEINALANK
ncbi:MAG: fatty acid desaturase [Cyanobacteria bacterium P01_F01_bin.13]